MNRRKNNLEVNSIKRENAITLISLIITIIILLILAGIVIVSFTRINVINKAKEAKEKTENAQIAENDAISNFEEKIAIMGWRNTEEKFTKNFNIYVDDKEVEKIPDINSKYIFTTYTSTNENAELEFDMTNWNFNIYKLTDSTTKFNLYFYEKDNMDVVLKLLNSNDKYSSKKELCNAKIIDIMNSKVTLDYILNSKGEMANEIISFLDSDGYTTYTDQDRVDGNNTSILTLNPGRYIVKVSCNLPYQLNSFFADDTEIKPLKDDMYVCEIKQKITVNWYCNHVGTSKYLNINYRMF